MRDYIGYGSAAALGYIHGGYKGAYLAGESYRKLSKMAPISPPKTPSKRKLSQAYGKVGKKARYSGKVDYKPKYKAKYKNKYKGKGVKKQEVEIHSELKKSFMKSVWHVKKIKGSTKTRIRLTSGNWTTLNATAGYQSLDCIGASGSLEQWLVATAAPNIKQAAVPYFSANPNQSAIGGSLFTSTIAPKQDRIVHKSSVFDIEMTNFLTSGAYVDVYLVYCKKDTARDPVQLATDLRSAYQGDSGTAVAAPGAAGLGTGFVKGYDDIYNVGNNFDVLPSFKQFYKVVKHTTIDLAGGATHRIVIDVDMNKLAQRERLQSAKDSGNFFAAGYSCFVMAFSRGQVVQDITTGGAPLPVYGATSIGVMTTQRVFLHYYEGNAGRLNVNEASLFYASGTTLANQKMISTVDTDIAVTKAL